MSEEEIHILQQNVINTINDLLDKRKLHWMEKTPEFCEGLKVGLEVAGIYGDKINEIFTHNKE